MREAALTAAAETSGIDDVEEHSDGRAILAALRGDVAAAQQFAALPGMRASEDPQDRAVVRGAGHTDRGRPR